MIAPRALVRRAQAVLNACGGEARNWRLSPIGAAPDVKAAWAAKQAVSALFHAREYLRFIPNNHAWSVARFAHTYTHNKKNQRIAHECLRSAVRHLGDAERWLLECNERRDAA